MNARKTLVSGAWLALRSEHNWAFVCFSALALLVFSDYRLGFSLNLALFYLFIIACAAWGAPVRAATTLTAIAALICALRELSGTRLSVSPGEALFNASMQVLLCLLVLLVISNFRNLKRNLQQQVKDRTRILESEVSQRRCTEEQLHKSLQQLRQLADNIPDVFWMRNAGELRMGYVSPAFEKIWGLKCKDLYQSPELWSKAIHEEDRNRVTMAMQTRQITGDYNEEFRIVRPDGSLRWIRDRSFPIRTTSGEVFRIVGISEDVTDRRRLERQILEISDREQARIGQDLHDGLCQRLVTLAFDITRLESELTAKSQPEAQGIRCMSQLVDELISEARATARGLFPVHLEADGLQHSMQGLAAKVTSQSGIDCLFVPTTSVLVRDGTVAMQLYRIAQEAVTNALKHSQASRIWINLATTEHRIELTIRDDGVGLSPDSGSGPGMGLHIMEYRARTIGATLSFSSEAGTGTLVTCTAPQSLA